MRTLFFASANVGDSEDLQVLADATTVCARCVRASTVEELGLPLLNELIMRCNRSLGEMTSTTTVSHNMDEIAQQDDAKNGGNKSIKRKCQAVAAATLAALKGGNLFASLGRFA